MEPSTRQTSFDDPLERQRGFSNSHRSPLDSFPLFGGFHSFPFTSAFDRVGFGAFPNGGSTSTSRVFSSSMHSSHSGGQGWVSETRSSRTINGVTESVCKRTDAHVSASFHLIHLF